MARASSLTPTTLLALAILLATATFADSAQLMTRAIKERPALLIAAFGTSTRAQTTYDVFEKQLREALPETTIRWAFTSEVIRERVNRRREKEGNPSRLKSVPQALADLEAEGFAKAAVLPLQIFPGEEYEEVLRQASGFPGLRVEFGETLLHRWEYVREVVAVLAKDFLTEGEGANVLVAHGSPQTAVGSNTTYLGLERDLLKRYPNAYLGCVEGIFTPEDALEPAKAHPGARVRIIPFMFVGGDHIMNDVMGDDSESWKTALVRAGKKVDVPMAEVNGETLYRGLGLIPEVNAIFIREAERALKRL